MSLETLIEGIANALGVSAVSLLLALSITLVSAGIIGRIAMRLGVWSGAIDARRRPQQAFTTQTPEQVIQASRAAQRQRGCFLLILIASFVLIVGPFLLQKWGLLDEALKVLRLVFRGILANL